MHLHSDIAVLHYRDFWEWIEDGTGIDVEDGDDLQSPGEHRHFYLMKKCLGTVFLSSCQTKRYQLGVSWSAGCGKKDCKSALTPEWDTHTHTHPPELIRIPEYFIQTKPKKNDTKKVFFVNKLILIFLLF